MKNAPPPPNGVPEDFFENPSTSNITIELQSINSNNSINGHAVPNSSGQELIESKDKDSKDSNKDAKDNGHSTLPEGFFDDPIMDAKVI